ncbi:MAG: hypothetical protein L0Y71_14590 [Gemmataceae bacterium]|nr:hypothetical protein [Gemmataceae bacterium]
MAALGEGQPLLMVRPIEDIFPSLSKGGFQITSPVDKRYNCIAFAAGDTDSWWWPMPDVREVAWPAGVACAETLDAFRDAFSTLGYVECRNEDFEPGVEKIAIFTDDQALPLARGPTAGWRPLDEQTRRARGHRP